MAAHLMVGVVLFANEDTLLLTDRTVFVVPTGMRLPVFRAGIALVVEYEVPRGAQRLDGGASSAAVMERLDGLGDIYDDLRVLPISWMDAGRRRR
jgi:hypothetical protein